MMPEPGTALAGEAMTLWDDGLLAEGLGSAPCDDEGIPHQRRPTSRRSEGKEKTAGLLRSE
jgi:hypothetical protein